MCSFRLPYPSRFLVIFIFVLHTPPLPGIEIPSQSQSSPTSAHAQLKYQNYINDTNQSFEAISNVTSPVHFSFVRSSRVKSATAVRHKYIQTARSAQTLALTPTQPAHIHDASSKRDMRHRRLQPNGLDYAGSSGWSTAAMGVRNAVVHLLHQAEARD